MPRPSLSTLIYHRKYKILQCLQHICVHSWLSILASALKLPILSDSHKALRMHFTGLEN